MRAAIDSNAKIACQEVIQLKSKPTLETNGSSPMRKVRCVRYEVAVAFVATTLMIAASEARAEPFEVLGLSLGSPADSVGKSLKIGNPIAIDYRRALSMGSFTLPEILFGEDLSDTSPKYAFASSRFAIDKEYIRVVFDLRSPQKVDYIKRVRIFSNETNPGFEELKASLIAKYGTPVDINMNNGYPIFLWSRNSQIVYSKRNILSSTCEQSLYGMGALAQAEYNGVAIQNKELPRCGSWLRAQLDLASYNKALVSKITIDAGDLTELSASYAYLMDQLRTGAASAAAGQADKARQNKAPL